MLISLAGVGLWLIQRDDSGGETAMATRGSIDVTVQTVGKIQATSAAVARAAAGGVAASVAVEAGDIVKQGDILVAMDREPFDRALSQAEEQLSSAEFSLQSAENRAGADVANQELQLDVLAAVELVEQAKQAREVARKALSNIVIVAPQQGTIIELLAIEGESIAANQAVARIATPDQFTLVADVDELDLPNIEPGAQALFRLDAFPASEISGFVQSTTPQARVQGGATVFSATISFTSPPELDIRPGMNADVTIVTAARDAVLLIPDRALTTVGDRSFVVIVEGDERTEREVELGYRGNGQVEIVEGLSEGDRVALH